MPSKCFFSAIQITGNGTFLHVWVRRAGVNFIVFLNRMQKKISFSLCGLAPSHSGSDPSIQVNQECFGPPNCFNRVHGAVKL